MSIITNNYDYSDNSYLDSAINDVHLINHRINYIDKVNCVLY